MLRRSLFLGTCLPLFIAIALPAHGDDLGRLFGTIAREVIRDQQRRESSPQAGERQQTAPRTQTRTQQPATTPSVRQQQPQMSFAERTAVQRALLLSGHYAGEVDGILGAGSRRAIASWQASIGATSTGYLLPQQAATLIATAPAEPDATVQSQPSQQAGSATTPPWQQNPAPTIAAPGTPSATDAASALPSFDSPAAAATSANLPPDAVIGDHALNDRLLIWAVVNNPALIERHDHVYRLMGAGLAPELRQNRISDPSLQREAVRAALQDADPNPPSHARLEREVSIHPAWDGKPARLTTIFPEIDGAATITEVVTSERGRNTGAPVWTLRLARPFYMPPPAGLDRWVIPRDDKRTKTMLQIDMSLDGFSPELHPDMGLRSGTAQATISRVALIRRPAPPRRQGDPILPDEVLHVWTGDAPALAAASRPMDAAELVETYGGAASDGRYVVDVNSGEALLEPEYDSLVRFDGTGEALTTALSLRRLVESNPARLPDVPLTQSLSQSFLSERERLDLFPAEIALATPSTKISELALHAAMTTNAEAVRDLVVARTPDLPIALRKINSLFLGEYDFGAGGFNLSVGSTAYGYLPMAGPIPDTSHDVTLTMSPDQAQALLERLTHVNPAGGPGRQVFVVVDYTLDDVAARASGSGPITAAELGTLTPRSRIERAALFLDPGFTEKLMDLPVPESLAPAMAGDGVEGPGEALYATTGKSLWGAFVRADTQGDVTTEMIMNMPQVYRGATAGQQARAAALREEMLASAQDSYWIAAQLDLDAYDRATGSFPITGYQLRPVPYENDISGLEPPLLRPSDLRDLEALRVTPKEAAAIEGFRHPRFGFAAYMLVRPDGVAEDMEGYGPALTFPRPEVILLGPAGTDLLPDPVMLRIAVQAPPRLDAVGSQGAAPSVAAPDAIFLDQEGMDLLALSLDSGIYDDDAWRRMLIQRLMKERLFAMEDNPLRGPLPWGNFFDNPQLTPQADIVTSLLPAFRDWTLARAAALPQDVLLPLGQVPQAIPGCGGLLNVTSAQAAADYRFVMVNAPTLLGDLTLPTEMPASYSETTRAGGDQVWAFDSAPRHSPCRYPRQVGEAELSALIPDGAGHVAGLVHAVAVPTPAANDQSANGLLLRLKTSDLRLEMPEGKGDIPAGLRGVVVIASSVGHVTGYSIGRGKGFEEILSLTPQDWAIPEAAALAAQDIVGLTLGMPLAEFETAAQAHLGQAILFTEATPGKGMFGRARGLLNPQTTEALVAVYAPHAEDQPVVAIMRRLPLAADQTSTEALKISLTGKYGDVSYELEEGSWLWGTLPDNEDGWGVCGGASLMGRPERDQAPQLIPNTDLDLPQGSYLNRPDFWFEGGWPEVVTDRPGQVDPARCGPVVGARVSADHGNGRMLQVWLMDRKLAGELDDIPATSVEAADIKL